MAKKILMHVCCAPCLIYPKETLENKGFQVKGYFYNPNIHPVREYDNRRQALESLLCADSSIIYAEYDYKYFLRAVANDPKAPARCKICWNLRLEQTARYAKENRFDYFTTTLLVSPYQDINIIKELGEKIAKSYSVNFYFEDFRPGFKKAHNEAKQKGIYCQKYCGCEYSLNERKAAKSV